MGTLSAEDVRLRPIYRVAEAARYLGVKPGALRTWAYGYEARAVTGPPTHKGPVITANGPGNQRSIPFIGLAEAMVLAAFRRAGLPMQRVRRAVAVLREQIGLDHVLASQRLYTDGAEVLFDFAERYDDDEIGGLVVVRSGQQVFRPVIEDYLTRITFEPSDGFALRLTLPITTKPILEVDPSRGFGRPRFVHGGAPLESVSGRLRGGDDRIDVARDFGLDVEELDDAIQAAA